MFRNHQATTWLAACAMLFGALIHSSVAAPPPGKGGGGTSPPSLPADLDVRYRVQFIPLPTTASYHAVHDVNDVHEAVGAYNDVDGFRVGYYYNADTLTLLTASQMIPSLPAEWVNTSFLGINNHGAIVGKVQDIWGFDQCILISPGPTGYSYEITSPVDESGAMDSHFTQINDFGDIVGISWDDAGVGYAFAYKPGLFETTDFAFFGPPGVWFDSMQVTNTRLGTVRREEGSRTVFDFLNGQESQEQLPANERNVADGLANDGQFTVNEAIVSQKGKNISYRYTPGIMVSGQYVWQGNLDDGYATLVNSAVGANAVGDVVGFNNISGVRWLRHADHPAWGYLDLAAMVVFRSVADAERWSLIPGPGVRVWGMSDRDPITGFGALTGENYGIGEDAAYVLIPEIVPQP